MASAAAAGATAAPTAGNNKDIKYERIVLEPSPDMEKEIEQAKGIEHY